MSSESLPKSNMQTFTMFSLDATRDDRLICSEKKEGKSEERQKQASFYFFSQLKAEDISENHFASEDPFKCLCSLFQIKVNVLADTQLGWCMVLALFKCVLNYHMMTACLNPLMTLYKYEPNGADLFWMQVKPSVYKDFRYEIIYYLLGYFSQSQETVILKRIINVGDYCVVGDWDRDDVTYNILTSIWL